MPKRVYAEKRSLNNGLVEGTAVPSVGVRILFLVLPVLGRFFPLPSLPYFGILIDVARCKGSDAAAV